MSDTDPSETPTQDAPAAADAPKKASTNIRPPSILSRPTDAAPRPGFRAPPNAKSKAQKAKSRKK